MTTPNESRELAVVDSRVPIQLEWSQEQLDALKATVAKDCSLAQFRVFVMACQRLGLDPFARQIVPIVQGEGQKARMTPQVTIDGFRLIADRTRKYGGQLGPFWCGKDGAWHEVWLEDGAPVAARVGVIRRDFDQPMWGVARFKSYNKGGIWATMPDVMIAKVAESLALRKAFPQELSGIYAPEELDAVDADLPQPATLSTTAANHNPQDVTPLPDAWEIEHRRAREMGGTEAQWEALRKGRELKTVRQLLDNKERQIRAQVAAATTREQEDQEQELAEGLAEEDAYLAEMAGYTDDGENSDESAPESEPAHLSEATRTAILKNAALNKRLAALRYRTIADKTRFLDWCEAQGAQDEAGVRNLIAEVEGQQEHSLEGLPVGGLS